MLRWIALLVLLVAVGAAVAAVLFRPAAEAGPEAGLTPEPASTAPEPGRTEPSAALPEPNVPPAGAGKTKSAAAAVTAAPTEPPAPPTAGDQRLVYFQQKYGGLSRADLKAQLAELDKLVEEQRQLLIDQRFDSGIYEVSLPGDPPLPKLPPGPDGQPPVSGNRAATDPGSGQTENRRTYLPFDEYPDFYDLQAEAAWLRKQAGN